MRKNSLYKSLKHPINFLVNDNKDEYAEENWQIWQSCFAAIIPLYDHKISSLENFDFGHVVTEGYFIFKIRSLKDVSLAMRIKFENRCFQIKRIIDLHESKQVMKIIALEIN